MPPGRIINQFERLDRRHGRMVFGRLCVEPSAGAVGLPRHAKKALISCVTKSDNPQLAAKETMRTTLILMVAAGLCAAGCNPLGTSKEEGDDTPPDQVATMPPTSPEAPADASSAAGTSAAATPEPPQFAPPGVFYLLASTSIETDAGVFGLKPGTQVVKQTDGSFIGEGHKLQLTPAQITNDLRVVRKVMAADDQAQNALRMRQQQAAAQRAAAAAATPAAVTPAGKRTTPRPNATPTRPPMGGALGPAQTRTKDGYIWKRDANGNWVPDRPVR